MLNIVMFLFLLKLRQVNFFFLIGIFRTFLFTLIINIFGLASTTCVPVTFPFVFALFYFYFSVFSALN